MKKNSLLKLFFMFVITSINLFPYGGGVSGYTLKTNSSGCGSCHSTHGSANTAVTVLIAGPTQLAPGQTGSFTAKITGGTGSKVGINISTSAGTLVISDNNLKVSNSELTQTSAKVYSGGQYTFNFKLTAPATTGNVTLYATGMSSKTAWNFATNFVVSVAADTVLAPTGLASSLIIGNPNKVKLQWTDNSSNETSFQIERKSTGAFAVIGTVNSNITNYTDSVGLSHTITYTYRVKALNASTSSGYSNESVIIYYLPVELSAFTGVQVDNSVVLNWTTASEKNNKGFVIERKSGSLNWTEIGFVSGKGTITSNSEYLFVDNLQNSATGLYSYRLIQYDFNGETKTLKQIEVDYNPAPKSFELGQNYPNPFNPTTRIQFGIVKQGNYKFAVFNSVGEKVDEFAKDYSIGTHSFDYSAKGLTSGIYYYSLTGEGYSSVKKMIIQK